MLRNRGLVAALALLEGAGAITAVASATPVDAASPGTTGCWDYGLGPMFFGHLGVGITAGVLTAVAPESIYHYICAHSSALQATFPHEMDDGIYVKGPNGGTIFNTGVQSSVSGFPAGIPTWPYKLKDYRGTFNHGTFTNVWSGNMHMWAHGRSNPAAALNGVNPTSATYCYVSAC